MGFDPYSIVKLKEVTDTMALFDLANFESPLLIGCTPFGATPSTEQAENYHTQLQVNEHRMLRMQVHLLLLPHLTFMHVSCVSQHMLLAMTEHSVTP